MRVLNLRNAAIALVAGVALSGCAYGPYSGLSVGAGYGNGYDPYYSGYGYGAQYGYGYGSPYGGYGSPYGGYGYGSPYGGYGSPYGYGYGSPYWGWNDGFYYPGTGYYVYDSSRRPYRWSDSQRRYWEQRRTQYVRRHNENTSDTTVATATRPEWGDFSNRRSNGTVRIRSENRGNDRVVVRSNDQIERQSTRSAERQDRRSARSEARGERRHGRNSDND